MLKIGQRTISIDSDTMVVPSLLAMHTHPRYWKEDPLTWCPSRWISSPSADGNNPDFTLARLEEEELFAPIKGSYFPWSDGPQNCPGKKFAQVEFVAVIACLLQSHRVRALGPEGESHEDAQKRILGICEDSEHGLLLRMRNADSVRLVWERQSAFAETGTGTGTVLAKTSTVDALTTTSTSTVNATALIVNHRQRNGGVVEGQRQPS
jgi:Cytochrome P450